MGGLPDDIGSQLSRIRTILQSEFEGNEAAMARTIGLPQATLNRSLNPNTANRMSTAVQRVRRVVDRLVENGYSRRWLERGAGEPHDEVPLAEESDSREETEESPTSIAIYIAPSIVGENHIIDEEPVGTIHPSSSVPSSPIFGTDEISGFYILIRGDAMVPSLCPGEIVPVESFTPPRRRISANGIYLYRHGTRAVVRRLEPIDDRSLRVISDKASYKNRHIVLDEMEGFSIFGQIIRWA